MWRALAVLTLLPAIAAAPTSAARPGPATAVFAGGCFWGVDAVFKHVKGVVHVVSGYAGGDAVQPSYGQVSTGTTGHAESVEVTYDSTQVSYDQLLQVFFLVAHDPTQLNRQGPDEGTQYRSVVFYATPEQHRAAAAAIATLSRQHVYGDPIVTQVVPLKAFYPAEEYHQNYLARHPDQPYIVYNDLPKLRRLAERFPALYQP
jgi:peptide-methionine (S)-S-oxide reductase